MRDINQPAVIALGEALVEVMRVAPGVTLSEPGQFQGPFPSGAPAIFADACARLGLHTGFIGTVGDDAFGRAFHNRLRDDNVDVTYLAKDQLRATGVAFVAYRQDGAREFVFHLRDAAAGQAPEIIASYFEQVRWVHITGSTLAGSLEWKQACEHAARLAKQHGAHVSFDPNIRPELLGNGSILDLCRPILAIADVVLPSGDELMHITGIADRQAALNNLFAGGVKLVVFKQGRYGSIGYTRDAAVVAPAIEVEERDPTGAGDAFAAGLAYALLNGMPLDRALALANEVGARAVTRLGPMEGLPILAALSSANSPYL